MSRRRSNYKRYIDKDTGYEDVPIRTQRQRLDGDVPPTIQQQGLDADDQHLDPTPESLTFAEELPGCSTSSNQEMVSCECYVSKRAWVRFILLRGACSGAH